MSTLSSFIASRICAWCKKPMGTDVATAGSTGLQSHGICPQCEETAFGDINKVQVELDSKILVAHAASDDNARA